MQEIQEVVPAGAVLPAQDSLSATGETSGVLDSLASGEFTSFWDKVLASGALFVQSILPEVIKATLVFVVLYIAYRVVRSILGRILSSSKRVDPGLEGLLTKTFSIVAWSFISVMVLSQFGLDITALLAGLSIIGLAAKDSLENFFSGVAIMIDRPFRIGDQVVVGDTYGTVQEITLRSTRLRTLNSEIMVMPNSLMINQKLMNHTSMGILRIEVPFSIAYKESTDEARSAVLGLVSTDSRIATDFPVEVVVLRLADSSVEMVLRFHIRESFREVPIRDEYTELIFKALKGAHIQIPFPHLQLFIDEAKGLLPQGGQTSSPSTVPWRPL